MIIIYIYFLVIWPIIIRIFDIEYYYYNGTLMAYTTPATIFAGYVLVSRTSVNLNLYNQIIYFFEKEWIGLSKCLYKINFFPSWYINFLFSDILNNRGRSDHAENDRKFSAIMF